MHKLSIYRNAKWVFLEKGFNFLNSFFVIFILTTHLGAEDFGVYAYVIALVSLFSFFASFGLDGILVREFVSGKHKDPSLIGSALFILGITSVFSCAVIFYVGYLYIQDTMVLSLIYVYALNTFAAPFNVFYAFFNAKMELAVLSTVRILALILIFGTKIIAIWLDWGLAQFILIEVVGIISMAALSFFVFIGKNYTPKFEVCLTTVKRLFVNGLPLLISSGAIVIYAKVDLILIEYLLDFQNVGVYSAAVRISEFWYVIPMTATTLLFPLILTAKKLSMERYYAETKFSSEILIVICTFFSLALFLLGPGLVQVAFPSEFESSGGVVRILALCGPFIGLGYINGRYMVAENLLYLSMRRNIYGLILNVLLNILLIPIYGIHGAAFSTLISVMYTGFLCLIFSRRTLDIFRIQCEALCVFTKPRVFISNLKSLKV
tara:strand:+ start:3896 stop:5200 length:1305 start_codon:yes stop_codon:yes gene_type:complete